VTKHPSSKYRSAFRAAFAGRRRGILRVRHRIKQDKSVSLKVVLLQLLPDITPLPRTTIDHLNFHGFDVEVGMSYGEASRVILAQVRWD
jgi:hypothetical protein